MKNPWKWLAVAACGTAILVAVGRLHEVMASEESGAYRRSGDIGDKIDHLAEKLDRLLDRLDDRTGRGGPPRGEHDGPPRDRPEHFDHPHHGRHDRGGPPRGPHRDLPPEVRERMQQAREEMKERMEKAKQRFQELEERVRLLEAEVAQLKETRQG